MPKRTDIKKILMIGSGPIIIGQACEFDYSGPFDSRCLFTKITDMMKDLAQSGSSRG